MVIETGIADLGSRRVLLVRNAPILLLCNEVIVGVGLIISLLRVMIAKIVILHIFIFFDFTRF